MLLHRKNSLKMFVCECFDLMRPEQKTNPYPQMLFRGTKHASNLQSVDYVSFRLRVSPDELLSTP